MVINYVVTFDDEANGMSFMSVGLSAGPRVSAV
jgi:hypothetical protein